MIKLTVLGINGLYPTSLSPCSAYLVEVGGKKILLDIGAGSFSKLLEKVEPEDIDLVVLSHLHFDHISDIGVYSYYLQQKGKKIDLICPFDQDRIALVSKAEQFNVSYINDGEIEISNGLKLKFYKTKHPVLCYAVSVIYNGKVLSYTADTNDAPFLDELFSSSDLVIADSAFLHSEWNENKPHLSATHCAKYAQKYSVKTLLSHINPNQTEEKILQETMKITNLCVLAKLKEYIV